MSVKVGELYAVLGLDTRPYDDGLDEAKKDAPKVGDGIGSGLAKGIAGAIGAVALGAVITSGLTQGLEMGAANDKLAAGLGLSEEIAERAGKAAGDIFADGWGDSIEEVNAAFTGIQRNIGDLEGMTDEAMHGIAESALIVAETFDQDVNGVTRAAGQLMRNGLAPDAQTAMDMITAAMQGPAGATAGGRPAGTLRARPGGGLRGTRTVRHGDGSAGPRRADVALSLSGMQSADLDGSAHRSGVGLSREPAGM
ncbi:MAG: hypothetical protein M0R73_12440 [Dehalococcoidia bacterium]|nr:hypothetical protein [Dehalococcoidia bacterium]